MRVITGRAKGRKLKAMKGSDKRPTTDRVKESIFSVIGDKIYDADVLDLFAGTGNLGIEALSRGARSALFVDNDVQAVKIIGENLKMTHFLNRTEIWTSDVFAALRRLRALSKVFDVIFADPPYAREYGSKTRTALEESGILRKEGLFVLEHSMSEEFHDSCACFKPITQKMYGQTAVHFFPYITAEE